MKGLSDKLIPIFTLAVQEIAKLSWVALIAMLCVAGILWLFGNEFGAKQTSKRALYGFALIQLANMLL